MSNGEAAPPTTQGNPFSLLAYVLFKVRHALEDREEAERPPRWVRLARGRAVKHEVIGQSVDLGVGGMGETLSFMAELTLDLEDLLLQTDAAKALADVSLELIQAATDEKFKAGVATLADVNIDDLGVLADINQATQEIGAYLEYIPEPQDIRGLGHELYRLLCIVQHAFPRHASNNAIDVEHPDLLGADHLNQDDSGKLRLCAWAYQRSVAARGLGASKQGEQALRSFGARRLFSTAHNSDLPARSAMTWAEGDAKVDIYEFNFTGADPTADIKELVSLLQVHGYNDPTMSADPQIIDGAIRSNLLKFQAINGLPVTGEVDNPTINRLLNLDYARKNLRRAKPYDESFPWPWDTTPVPVAGELRLVNPDAEYWLEEGLELVQATPHPYYVIPTTPGGKLPADTANWPEGQGWIADGNAELQFVVAHSRARNLDAGVPGRFVGGLWSEGEAAHGHYFFAARLTEPWKDGRAGTPGPDALFPAAAAGVRSRMYQWVPLPGWLSPSSPPDDDPGWTLSVYASVLQRSLFSDRSGDGYPDRGRIVLEVYGADVYTDNLSPRKAPPLAKAETEFFPSRGETAAALDIDEVDRKRSWFLRQTEPVTITEQAKALCLVAEGEHQSGFDTDAYFDDFRLFFAWSKEA